ncbi:hypothetical protein AB0D04_02015 [Streptomyces sp. NPDC048483]|uniref:hypothetical protein n=1 Tax=Streptomyces sp. NPDC048483 TaxID=3154927 RepID=UPI0034190B37
MSDEQRPAEVGDLVRDLARGVEAVVTDVRDGVLLLRRRYGGGLFPEPWAATDGAVRILARRGAWDRP